MTDKCAIISAYMLLYSHIIEDNEKDIEVKRQQEMNAYTIVILLMAVAYTFYMGFSDGANAVATCVATRAIKPHYAIIIAGIVKFAAPTALRAPWEPLSTTKHFRVVLPKKALYFCYPQCLRRLYGR